MSSDDRPVRERLAEVLDVWEVVTASDGERSIRARTAEYLADAILADTDLLDALCRERIAALTAERDRLLGWKAIAIAITCAALDSEEATDGT